MFFAYDASRARLLIRHKARVNEQNNEGKTPLYYAIDHIKPDRELIKVLLINGADVNMKDNKGISPIDIAREKAEKSKEMKDIYNMMLKYNK